MFVKKIDIHIQVCHYLLITKNQTLNHGDIAMSKQRVVLGICNGSMEEPTIELFKKIGVNIRFSNRAHETEVEISESIGFIAHVLRMRPSAIPKNIKKGVVDCAVMGLDWLMEYEPQLLSCTASGFPPFNIITKLSYARTSRQSTRIVIVRKQGKRLPYPEEGSSVYSEYPNLAKSIWPEANVECSDGSTEAEVAKGLYEYGLCVTETGDTIKAIGLMSEVICPSPMVLVSQETTDEIKALGEMLAGALNAEPMELIKMNAPNEKVRDEILKQLPALSSPTVNSLASKGFAIETVVPKHMLLPLFIELRKCGATDWLQHDLNVVVR